MVCDSNWPIIDHRESSERLEIADVRNIVQRRTSNATW
jgi:hypothetical protein